MRNIDEELREVLHQEACSRRQFGEEDHIILKEIVEYVTTIVEDYLDDPDNDI